MENYEYPEDHCPFCEGRGQAYGCKCVCMRSYACEWCGDHGERFAKNNKTYLYDFKCVSCHHEWQDT